MYTTLLHITSHNLDAKKAMSLDASHTLSVFKGIHEWHTIETPKEAVSVSVGILQVFGNGPRVVDPLAILIVVNDYRNLYIFNDCPDLTAARQIRLFQTRHAHRINKSYDANKALASTGKGSERLLHLRTSFCPENAILSCCRNCHGTVFTSMFLCVTARRVAQQKGLK